MTCFDKRWSHGSLIIKWKQREQCLCTYLFQFFFSAKTSSIGHYLILFSHFFTEFYSIFFKLATLWLPSTLVIKSFGMFIRFNFLFRQFGPFFIQTIWSIFLNFVFRHFDPAIWADVSVHIDSFFSRPIGSNLDQIVWLQSDKKTSDKLTSDTLGVRRYAMVFFFHMMKNFAHNPYKIN